MSVNIHKITAKQKRELCQKKEDHFFDRKAVDIAPKKLTKTLSGFANADGGELHVGIDDNGQWRGFSDVEGANGLIQCIEEYFPLGQYVDFSFLSLNEKDNLVLHVLVHKTPDIRKASDGSVYLRRGAQNIPVKTPEALHRLELDKGVISFENHTIEFPLSEICNSTVIIEFMLDVIPSAEPLQWLSKQRLVVSNKPTVAGTLLFAEEPQALLPKRSGIKIYRYATKDAKGTRETLVFDPLTIEGHLYKQIREAVTATARTVEHSRIMSPDGLETIQYPTETLHEIITNAVIHRDYSLPDDIHVRVFDNRVEIESPGKLPGHITEKNILEERFARNGQIVRILNKFPNPPNKDIGEGLRTAFEAMKKLDLREPEISERRNSVVVYIRHERLASPEVLIMEYLDNHSEISNKQARDICHIGSENKVKNIFKKMIKADMIERIPGRSLSKTAYRKTNRVENVNNGSAQESFSFSTEDKK